MLPDNPIVRDNPMLAGALCVALAAAGAMLLHLQLPVAAAVIGLPGWIGAIVLLALCLRPAASFLLVLAVASLGDRLSALDISTTPSQRLLLLALAAAAWGAGWAWRQRDRIAAERRHRDQHLHWQEPLYHLMLDSTGECVKLIRADGTLLRINPAGVNLLEAESADALLGVNWLELWGPNTGCARAAFAEALTHGVAAFEAPALTLKGSLRQWRNRIAVVQESGGERQLLCFSADISAACDVEQQRRDIATRQQQLVEYLPAPAFTIDAAGNITCVNARAAAALQLAPGCLPDRQALHRQLPATAVEDIEASLAEALRTGQPRQSQFYWPQRMAWVGITLIPGDDGAMAVINDLSGALAAQPRPAELEQRRLAQEISGVGDWLFNAREGLLILSPGALHVLGLPASTPLQSAVEGGHLAAVLAALHPDDRAALMQAVTRAASSGDELQVTVRRVDAVAPGGLRYLCWRGRLVSDVIEGLPQLVGVVRDVTHEQVLADQAEHWRRLLNNGFDTLPLDALVIDREGRVVVVNQGFRRARSTGPGRPPVEVGDNYPELLGRLAEALPEPHRLALLGYRDGLLEIMRGERESLDFEYRAGEREYRAHCLPVAGTNLIVSAHVDVTSTKRLTDSVAEHDRRLAQAMGATLDGVWVWSPQTGRTFYSPQFAALLHYPIGDLPGFDQMLLTTTHPDDQASVQVQLAEFSPPVHGHTFSLEVRLLVASVQYRWFRLRGEVQRADGDVEIVGSIMDIQSERDLQQKIYDVAFCDEITRLPNRQAFYRRLQDRCDEADANFALLLVDIDRFKNINASLGVTFGDDLLRQVADRLKRLVSGNAFVARLSGDEFAVMLPAAGREVLETQIRHLLDGMRPAFYLDGQDMFITASIGAASCPHDGSAPEQLLRAVDVALRGAKSGGRNSFRFFESALQLPGRERLVLETELRQALERNEFELFYQGKFDLRSDALTGAEALLRWRSQQRGLVAPGEFVPLLEETGLILPVGAWALREACRQVNAWHEQTGRWIRVAVNVSTIQMAARDFCETAIGILRESCIPPQTIELEITESALMADIEQGAQLLKELKLAGFSIALDDFGTGYSSLGYLRRFSPNTLKMDRSFMADLESDTSAREIAAGIVQLARALSIDVVAEGIETRAQRDILRGMRCPIGQGYLFAKPLPVPEFEQKLLAVQPARVINLDSR
jgi:diguanylate cyclase (GGDEF)-like protein